MASPTIIKLESSEGKVFEVSKEIVQMSVTLSNMLEDLSTEESTTSSGELILPIANVDAATLQKVVEYCKYHHIHPVPLPDKEDYRTDNITDWDKTFIDVEMKLLFDIVRAANFMDIKGLLDLCCKTIANKIKGKSPEEVKSTFAIPKQH